MKLSTVFLCAVPVAAAVLLAPAALGATRPDDKAGQIGVGAVVVVATQTTHPNDQAGVLGVGRASLGTWAGERDYGLYSPTGGVAGTVTPVVATEPSGRDWGTIATAAGLVVLAVLLIGGVVAVTEHRGPFKPVPH